MNNQHITQMVHKFKEGDKVILTIEAEVTECIPFTFVEPGYTVKIGKVTLAVSERSIAKIESQDTDQIHNAVSEPHSDARDRIAGLSGPED